MGIRETLREKPVFGWTASGVLVLVAVAVLARTYWPQKKADLSQTFFTDDDGKTWFSDSAYQVPPFPHNGKTAVVAQIYSYAGGSKRFCAYVAKFTPEAKQQLEAALADAKQKGQPPGTVALYHDALFMKHGTLVKKPGAGGDWVPMDDPKANDVMSVQSPDGSELDQVFVY